MAPKRGIEYRFKDPAREAELGWQARAVFGEEDGTQEPVYLVASRARTAGGLVFPEELGVLVGTGMNDVVVLGSSEGGF